MPFYCRVCVCTKTHRRKYPKPQSQENVKQKDTYINERQHLHSTINENTGRPKDPRPEPAHLERDFLFRKHSLKGDTPPATQLEPSRPNRLTPTYSLALRPIAKHTNERTQLVAYGLCSRTHQTKPEPIGRRNCCAVIPYHLSFVFLFLTYLVGRGPEPSPTTPNIPFSRDTKGGR